MPVFQRAKIFLTSTVATNRSSCFAVACLPLFRCWSLTQVVRLQLKNCLAFQSHDIKLGALIETKPVPDLRNEFIYNASNRPMLMRNSLGQIDQVQAKCAVLKSFERTELGPCKKLLALSSILMEYHPWGLPKVFLCTW